MVGSKLRRQSRHASAFAIVALYAATVDADLPHTIAGHGVQPVALSADGSVVVGYYYPDGIHETAFRWTLATGTQSLGALDGLEWTSRAYAVSPDGAVVVGGAQAASGSFAFRWTASGGMESLGTLSGFSGSFASGVDADGTTVACTATGSAGTYPFRWSLSQGIVPCPVRPDAIPTTANGISSDGRFVAISSGTDRSLYCLNVGEVGYESAGRWDENPTAFIGPLTDGHSHATCISGDGSTLGGVYLSAPCYPVFRGTFRWRIGQAPQLFAGATEPHSLSADGSMILLGYDSLHIDPIGFVYPVDALASQGIHFAPRSNTILANCMSADGQSLAGTASVDGFAYAWVANAPCRLSNLQIARADANCDCAVNNFDIDAFILRLLDPVEHGNVYPGCSSLRGDADRDGVVNNFDIDPFVDCILTGCH